MVEKKIVVDQLRLSYNGVFDINDFYNAVEDWIQEKGMEKETKKKLEHVMPHGKKLEWYIECWKSVASYAKTIVRMRALFDEVKEVQIVKNKSKRRLNQGKVLIILDGILETDIEGSWQQKPLFYFMRALVDKYIWKFHTNKYEAPLIDEVYDMHKTLKKFFARYNY
ncbi:hypothetical protein J4209_01895 [Candidatus Woesearchaeota archaeon]|nr:hypothetical protein [Candidatus Woesearchaeota archaeon]